MIRGADNNFAYARGSAQKSQDDASPVGMQFDEEAQCYQSVATMPGRHTIRTLIQPMARMFIKSTREVKNLRQGVQSDSSEQDRRDSCKPPKQVCLLCLNKDGDDFAIAVPCAYPQIVNGRKWVRSVSSGAESALDGDTDAAIFEKLRQVSYIHCGMWKRWLPYYGPVQVNEVEVRSYIFPQAQNRSDAIQIEFYGYCNNDGSFAISVKKQDMDKLKAELEGLVREIPPRWMCEEGVACWGGDEHTDECQAAQEMCDGVCVTNKGHDAEERLARIGMLKHLTKAARRPSKAEQKFQLLDGISVDRLIYEGR